METITNTRKKNTIQLIVECYMMYKLIDIDWYVFTNYTKYSNLALKLSSTNSEFYDYIIIIVLPACVCGIAVIL